MADKATLLQKLPPVGKESSSSSPAHGDASVGTELQAGPEPSITAFQATTYGSYVLTFVLAGFAAVVLFRKALDAKEPSLSSSAKILAGAFALMSFQGFFASSRYTSFLRNEADLAPLSLTVLIWVILGAAVGYISNRIIELHNKPRKTDAIVDGLLYATIFAAVTIAMSPKVGPNTALILLLASTILYTVPLSRFFIACKFVKLNRQAWSQKSGRSLLFSAVLLPTLLPIIAFCYIGKAFGPSATLFSINLLAITFIICLSLAMLAGLKGIKDIEGGETAAIPSNPKADEVPAAPQMDPLVAELLAEEAAMSQSKEEETKPSPKPESSKPSAPTPPQKPTRPNQDKEPPTRKVPPSIKRQPDAPKKPKQAPKNDNQTGADKVTKFKPPSKPKKRT